MEAITIDVSALDAADSAVIEMEEYPDVIILRHGERNSLEWEVAELVEKVDYEDFLYGVAEYSVYDLLSFLQSDEYAKVAKFVILDRKKIEAFDPSSDDFKAFVATHPIRDDRQLPKRGTPEHAFNPRVSEEIVKRFLDEKRGGDHYLLLRYVWSDSAFIELEKVYDRLYEKHRESGRRSFSIKERIMLSFPDDEQLSAILSDEELSLYKFTLMTDITEELTYYVDKWRRQSAFLSMKTDLKADAFERFGITDEKIDEIWREKKMHFGYFFARIKQGKCPNPYHCNGEYVTKETEVYLWRWKAKYMQEALEWTREMCEPEDRG